MYELEKLSKKISRNIAKRIISEKEALFYYNLYRFRLKFQVFVNTHPITIAEDVFHELLPLPTPVKLLSCEF